MPKPEPEKTKKHSNTQQIPNIVLASIRYKIGLQQATAAIAAAALIDRNLIPLVNLLKAQTENTKIQLSKKLKCLL